MVYPIGFRTLKTSYTTFDFKKVVGKKKVDRGQLTGDRKRKNSVTCNLKPVTFLKTRVHSDESQDEVRNYLSIS